ncbi:MAG: M16 family metallopeptidase [Phycisphaerae bacterium]
MSEKFYTRQLPNGMMLLGQRMEHVTSASLAVAVPAGAARDDDSAAGAAAVAREWMLRGAGERDTRQLNEALDSLGCRHSEDVRSEHLVVSAGQLGTKLPDVLSIVADVLRRPRLADDGFEPSRELTLQELTSLEDEPIRKCFTLVRERFYPHPLGRCPYGSAETLKSLTPDAVRESFRRNVSPDGTILAVAGDIDWDSFVEHAERQFGDWSADAPPQVQTRPPADGVTHIPKQTAQAHIALAHRSATISDPHYYAARMAETVLSGGMSSRLFTEVREKRGLVYHVSARYHGLKDHAGIFTYAGTTPENAQETLDVTVGELRRLREGIGDDEMDRARTQLKSSLVMQGESTGARAAALAADWYHLRRLRSLREISEAVDAVTKDHVMEYLEKYPAENFTVLVIAPEPVNTDGIAKKEVSSD